MYKIKFGLGARTSMKRRTNEARFATILFMMQ